MPADNHSQVDTDADALDRLLDVTPILDPLRQLSQYHGFNRHTIFSDFLDIVLYSLQGDDKAFHDLLDRYDDADRSTAAECFSHAFAGVCLVSERTGKDALGDAYTQFGLTSDSFGQFFTPHNTSQAIAEIQCSADDGSNPDERTTIHDPACGSGRLLLYAAQQYDSSFVSGVDKDPQCAKMAAINATVFKLDGLFAHGDSLSLEFHTAWRTRAGRIRSVPPETVGDLLHDESHSPPAEEKTQSNQDSGPTPTRLDEFD